MTILLLIGRQWTKAGVLRCRQVAGSERKRTGRTDSGKPGNLLGCEATLRKGDGAAAACFPAKSAGQTHYSQLAGRTTVEGCRKEAGGPRGDGGAGGARLGGDARSARAHGSGRGRGRLARPLLKPASVWCLLLRLLS